MFDWHSKKPWSVRQRSLPSKGGGSVIVLQSAVSEDGKHIFGNTREGNLDDIPHAVACANLLSGVHPKDFGVVDRLLKDHGLKPKDLDF